MLSMVVEDEDRPGLEPDLDALVRDGARRMLVTALKAEVDAYVAVHAGERDGEGHLAMAYRLLEAAQARWRCVNAPHLVALVRAGATFVDGVQVEREDRRDVA